MVTEKQMVVGAIIANSVTSPTRVLVARRVTNGLWEFPGGTVEAGQAPKVALKQAILQTLGIVIKVRNELKASAGTWPVSDARERRLFFARKTGKGRPHVDGVHSGLMWASSADIAQMDWAPADLEPARAVASTLGVPIKSYWVYVVELDASAYPYAPRGAVYVGETGKTPEQRFADHKSGERTSSREVRNHGLALLRDLIEGPFETEDEALDREAEKAFELRQQGYHVPGTHGVRASFRRKE